MRRADLGFPFGDGVSSRVQLLPDRVGRHLAAMDTVGDSHTSVGVSRKSQGPMACHSRIDACHAIQVTHTILRHGVGVPVNTGKNRLPGDSEKITQLAANASRHGRIVLMIEILL